MLEVRYVEESELPKFTDKKMVELARHFEEEWNFFKDARQDLSEIIWPACDKAYMCFRELVANKHMAWVDNGALGETDIRDAISGMLENLLLDMMPPDESWLEVVSDNEEDQALLDKIKQQQTYLHHEAKTRHQYGQHLLQLMVRGTSFIGVHWEQLYKVTRMGNVATRRTLQRMVKQSDARDENGDPINVHRMRQYELKYNGPVIYPIDNYRVWLDPTAQLAPECDIASIRLVYKTPGDLKDAVDERGNPVYDQKALEEVQPYTPQEIYNEDKTPFESIRNMGITVERNITDSYIVPVYIFHRQVMNYDGMKFVDRFFYVARSKQGGWRIIRSHENPSDYGDKPFYMDTYSDWLNVPYGTGAVEKSLSTLKAKNIISALSLNAQVATVFPAMTYLTGIIKDDRRPMFGPGALNAATFRLGVGLDFIKPMPVPEQGAILSIQDQQLLGQKILSQTGATGSTLFTDPTKTLAHDKTATQVRQETTNAVSGRSNQIEKFTLGSLQPMCQTVYNLSRQNLKGKVKYIGRDMTGKPTPGNLKGSELNEDRRVLVMGRRALANKAHEMANLQEALKIAGSGNLSQMLPTLPILVQELFFKIMGRLGIMITPEMKTDPTELVAQNPEVALQTFMKVLHTPEGLQAAAHVLEAMGLSNPTQSMQGGMFGGQNANVQG